MESLLLASYAGSACSLQLADQLPWPSRCPLTASYLLSSQPTLGQTWQQAYCCFCGFGQERSLLASSALRLRQVPLAVTSEAG
ncbi:hypothetical protein AMTR_s03399p00007410 [Amborella trichopoda]|uniref:Uncharacterized protein n=1 Tax=Amborella trichopoda TaxID=13333 RepID=U5D6N9_AMBTC|nr:hypothetical protein AMTR_s03399p00007410 [Amborella trichopoda]